MLDKIENYQLGILIQLYQKQLRDLQLPEEGEQGNPSYNSNKDNMVNILKILCYVYENKYMKSVPH